MLKKVSIGLATLLLSVVSMFGSSSGISENQVYAETKSEMLAISVNPTNITAQEQVKLDLTLTVNPGQLENGGKIVIEIPKNITSEGVHNDNVSVPADVFDSINVTEDNNNYYIHFERCSSFGTVENEALTIGFAVVWKAPLHHEGGEGIPTGANFKASLVEKENNCVDGNIVEMKQVSATYTPLGPASLPIFAKWTDMSKSTVYDGADYVSGVAQVSRPEETDKNWANVFQLVVNYNKNNLGQTVVTDTLPLNTSFVAPGAKGVGTNYEPYNVYNNTRILKAIRYNADGWPVEWKNVTDDFREGNVYGNAITVDQNDTGLNDVSPAKLNIVFNDIGQDDVYCIEYAVKIDEDQTPSTYKVRENNAVLTYQGIKYRATHKMSIRDKYGYKFSFLKTTTPEKYQIGSKTLDYKIEIKNDAVDGIDIPAGSKIVDKLIPQLSNPITKASSYTSEHLSEDKTFYEVANNTITWELDNELKRGESLAIEFSVTVNDIDDLINIGNEIANTADLIRDGAAVLTTTSKTEIVGKASVEINKVDSKTQQPLKGATFELWDESLENRVAYGETNSDGKLSFSNIELGNYKLKESIAPNGYEASNEIFDVVLDKGVVLSQNSVFNITIQNVREKGSVKITKIDADDKTTALEGAKFILARKSGNNKEFYAINNLGKVQWVTAQEEATEFITDINGEITVTGLDSDENYIWIEIMAPTGYEIPQNNETAFSFTLDDNSIELKIENKKMIENPEEELPAEELPKDEDDDGDVLGEIEERDQEKAHGDVLGDTIQTWDATSKSFLIIMLMIAGTTFISLIRRKRKI